MRHLYCAMRLHGIDNFHIELIEECKSFKDMVAKEAYYCKKYEAYTKGYNMTTAGEINPMECSKSKLSHDLKMQSAEVRKRISKSMKKVRAQSLNTITIHRGREGKRVAESCLQDYLDDGWELGANSVGKIRLHRLSDLKETSV